MSIKFNEVTWYSKLAAVLVLLGTIYLIYYFVGQYQEVARLSELVPVSGKAISVTGDMAISIGGSSVYDGLEVSFNKVTNDSRCPVDVKCIQAGSVTANITLKAGDKVKEVSLVSDGVLYRFANYAITFNRVSPVRHSQTQIYPSNYVAVFQVAKISGI